MTYDTLIYEKKEKIAYITLNRPQVMNAMNRKMGQELSEVWGDFKLDPDVWVAIVTGAGDKAFSSGADLKDRFVDGRQEMADQFWTPPAEGGAAGRREIWKPIIAAINGYCLAGGLELALSCDLRIASENATFGMSEVLRGIIPGSGAQMLPRQIPYVFAMELLLTGDRFNAQEAYRIGLINRVVPKSELMPVAEEMAGKIARNAPLAVRAIKESLTRGMEQPLDHALRMNALFSRVNLTTEDSAEGPLAFTEKRPPQYKGR